MINAGEVRIFSGANGALLHTLEGEKSSDKFGLKVAGVGDVDGDGRGDLIVGSREVEVGGNYYTGKAYLYSGRTGSLIRSWEGTDAYDEFGYAVGSVGDVDGDGVNDVAVGARGFSTATKDNAGRVYVYSGAMGSLLHTFTGADEAELGEAVCTAGDVDGDGRADIAVGAPHLDLNLSNRYAGEVVVYSGASGAVLWRLTGTKGSQLLGTSLAPAGDVNQDGVPDLIVGAPGETPGGMSYAGEVWIVSGADQSILRVFEGESAWGYFGWSVAGVGDQDQDGVPDVFAGAFTFEGAAGGDAGAVYLYSAASGALLYRQEGETADDELGISVDRVGDINGDGTIEFMAGARDARPNGRPFEGVVHVLGLTPYLSASQSTVSVSAGGTIDYALDFGTSAAGVEYRVVFSATGRGPTNYGIDIPLSFDSLAQRTFFGFFPVPTSGMAGFLDGKGRASASLTVPSGLPSSLVGRNYYAAALTLLGGAVPPDSSSISQALTILP